MSSTLTVCMPYVAITLLVVFFTNFRWSLSQAYLTSLTVYRMPAKEDKPKEQLKTSQARNRQKKLNKKNREENLQGQICVISTTKEGLLQRIFFSEFDKLVFFGSVVAANLVAFQLLSWVKGDSRGGSVLTCLAAVAMGSGILSLVQTQVDSEVSPMEERVVGTVAAIGSGVSAALVLLLAPPEVLDFELDNTASALTHSLKLYLDKTGYSELGVGLDPQKGPFLCLLGVLVLLAAIIGGVSVAPAVRCVRGYMLATSPPDWAQGHLGEGWWRKMLLHVNIILPMAVFILWIRPLLETPLEVPASHMLHLRIGAVLLSAIVQALLLRTQVQAYLDSGFVAWYERLYGSGIVNNNNGGKPQDKEAELYSRAVQMSLEVNNTLMCKVAVQAFAPAVMLLSCAALMWHKGVLTKDLDNTALFPPLLFKSMFSFIAWWFCGVWTIFSYVTLGLFRYGQLT